MRIADEDTIYNLNIEKMAQDMLLIYKNHMVNGIPLSDGKTLHIDKNSLSYLAMKQVAALILVPMLGVLFRTKGIEMEKAPRHSDIIDYCMEQLLLFIQRYGDETNIYVTTSRDDTTGIKNISTFSTKGPQSLSPVESSSSGTEATNEEKNENTGG